MKELNLDALPRWARIHIDNLNGRIQALEGQLRELRELPDSPFKHAPDPSKINEYVNLPEQHSLRVFLPQGWLDVRVATGKYLTDLHEASLYVMAEYGINVHPASYNTVHLIPEKPR